MNATNTKSEIFKTAWKLVREAGITISDALRAAWSAFKINAKVFTSKAWNGKVSICFSAETIDGARFTSDSIERLKMFIAGHSPISLSGAAADYGRGMYNGD